MSTQHAVVRIPRSVSVRKGLSLMRDLICVSYGKNGRSHQPTPARPTPARPPRIPCELIDIVIDHLYDDKETLAKCSTVSKYLLHSSWYHLFRTLCIQWDRENKEFDMFMAFLDTNPACVRYIQYLRLEGYWRTGPYMVSLILDKCTAIRSLTLVSLAWDAHWTNGYRGEPTSVPWSIPTRSLDALVLTVGDIQRPVFQLSDILHILSPFRHIRSLRIEAAQIIPGSLSSENVLNQTLEIESLFVDARIESPCEKRLFQEILRTGSLRSLRDVAVTVRGDLSQYSTTLQLLRDPSLSLNTVHFDFRPSMQRNLAIDISDFPDLLSAPILSVSLALDNVGQGGHTFGWCICTLPHILRILPRAMRTLFIEVYVREETAGRCSLLAESTLLQMEKKLETLALGSLEKVVFAVRLPVWLSKIPGAFTVKEFLEENLASLVGKGLVEVKYAGFNSGKLS